MESRLITLAIHTYDYALALKSVLEAEGIAVELHNVNLEMPGLSSGVRVRIRENDLPLALRIVENRELFSEEAADEHVILVPVDFSELSYRAVAVAAAFSASHKARLHLLYSYMDPYLTGAAQFKETLNYDDGEPRARAFMRENGERLMANFRDRVRNAMRRGDIKPAVVSTVVTEGVPEDAIVEHGKSLKPMLVVMGTRGARRKQEEMIGSITAEVLDEGRFMVMTVPEPLEGKDLLRPSRILYLSNLDQDDILAIDSMVRLLQGTEATVTIMHVPQRRRFSDSGAGKALQKLSKYCGDNFTNYHFESVPISPDSYEEAFAELHAREKFDLIVAPSRRRNAFSRLFSPGLSHKILFQTDVPMLVIPV